MKDLNIYFYDYYTNKKYREFDKIKKDFPEADKRFYMLMVAISYYPQFIKFVVSTRKYLRIPEEGYNLRETLGYMENEDALWYQSQSLVAEHYQNRLLGEYFPSIASIILGNVVIMHINSVKSIFFDLVDPSRISSSRKYPAIVFNPDRNVTETQIKSFIDRNKEIQEYLKGSHVKNYSFDIKHLEMYLMKESDPSLKYDDIANLYNAKYAKNNIDNYLGEENVKKIVYDVRLRLKELLEPNE